MTGDRRLTTEEMKLFKNESKTIPITFDAMKIIHKAILDAHDEPSLFEISIIELAAKLETQKDWIIFLSRRIKKLEDLLEEPIKK